jgi:hypothetical protein
MNAKELRVGNLIGFNINHNEIGVVSEILKNQIGINHRLDMKYHIENLKPIELTYQWLDKFGFEFKDAGDFGHYYSLEDFDLNQDYQPIDFDCIEIKYVHQLQNVYFALTGKELEIK